MSAALAGGCSGPASQDERASAPIRKQTGEERAVEDRSRKDAAARYESALRTAPAYRSQIRDQLISNPDIYEAGYRPLLDDFRGLESEFRCIHPPEVIERAQADRWQLVKCDPQSAMLFRRHGKDLGCRGRRTIPDDFEILQLWFEPPGLSSTEDLGSAQTRALYHAMPDVYDEVSGQEIGDLFVTEPEKNLIIRQTSTNETMQYFVMDHDRRLVISLHRPKTSQSCTRNARGWIVSGRRIATLDSPLRNYDEMSDALELVVAYFGAE